MNDRSYAAIWLMLVRCKEYMNIGMSVDPAVPAPLLNQYCMPSYSFIVLLQRLSIACYAERCISHSKSVRPSVWPSDCPSHAGTESKRLQLRSWGLHCRIAPWLVSSRLTSPRNSKGNIGSEGAEWDRGRKNRQFLANKSPYLENGTR